MKKIHILLFALVLIFGFTVSTHITNALSIVNTTGVPQEVSRDVQDDSTVLFKKGVWDEDRLRMLNAVLVKEDIPLKPFSKVEDLSGEIKKLQAKYKIPQTGFVGEMTTRKLNELALEREGGSNDSSVSSVSECKSWRVSGTGKACEDGLSVNETTVTYPPGCSSREGFSYLTGVRCDGSQNELVSVPGCKPGYVFSSTTGMPCKSSPQNTQQQQVVVTTDRTVCPNGRLLSENCGWTSAGIEQNYFRPKGDGSGVNVGTGDRTPRIMYWPGKVSQHIDQNGFWQTDPDGVSGSLLNKLEYCKKWYPGATSLKPYKSEHIETWKERGNINNWQATVMSEECVSGGSVQVVDVVQNTNKECSATSAPSITVLSPNGGEVLTKGEPIKVKWTSCNIPKEKLLEVNVYNSTPMIFGFLAPNGTPNDGEETFETTTWPAGSQYNIIVGVPDGNAFNNSAMTLKDKNDTLFTLQ